MQFFARCIVPFPVFSILNGSVFGGEKGPYMTICLIKCSRLSIRFTPKLGGFMGCLCVHHMYVCMYVCIHDSKPYPIDVIVTVLHASCTLGWAVMHGYFMILLRVGFAVFISII